MQKKHQSAVQTTAVMSAIEVLYEAQTAGIRISVNGGDLVVEAPPATSPELLGRIGHYKADIVALLRRGKDGWCAFDWNQLYRACVKFNEAEGPDNPDNPDEAKDNAHKFCADTWLDLNRPISPDCLSAYCGIAAQPNSDWASKALRIGWCWYGRGKSQQPCQPGWT